MIQTLGVWAPFALKILQIIADQHDACVCGDNACGGVYA